jgi:hypothetical protein
MLQIHRKWCKNGCSKIKINMMQIHTTIVAEDKYLLSKSNKKKYQQNLLRSKKAIPEIATPPPPRSSVVLTAGKERGALLATPTATVPVR